MIFDVAFVSFSPIMNFKQERAAGKKFASVIIAIGEN